MIINKLICPFVLGQQNKNTLRTCNAWNALFKISCRLLLLKFFDSLTMQARICPKRKQLQGNQYYMNMTPEVAGREGVYAQNDVTSYLLSLRFWRFLQFNNHSFTSGSDFIVLSVDTAKVWMNIHREIPLPVHEELCNRKTKSSHTETVHSGLCARINRCGRKFRILARCVRDYLSWNTSK